MSADVDKSNVIEDVAPLGTKVPPTAAEWVETDDVVGDDGSGVPTANTCVGE
jgi:hypothetical protein